MTQIVMRWLSDGRSQWLAADGRVHEGLPAPSADLHLTVLVPGEDVLLLETARVARSAHQLDQAIPYAVEEQLAAPVEAQHVAWAALGPDRVRVAVAAHERMAGWLEPLRAAGLEPDVLLPDTLALPTGERPQLLVDGSRCLLRLDDSRALALEADTLHALSIQQPDRINGWRVDGWLVDTDAAPLPLHEQHRPAHALGCLAAGAARPVLNLLQANYAPRRRVDGAQRSWRLAAVLAGAAVVLVLLAAVVDQRKLAARVAEQQQEMAQLYRRAVPDASNADNPAQQLQSVLAAQGLTQGDAALDLLARAAPALAADARLSLESLEYREGRIDLSLQAADVAGLDALRQRLVAAGLPVEITGSTPGTQGVQGRLRIGGSP